jgi:hypothetical protein
MRDNYNVALPLEKLEPPTLQRETQNIGHIKDAS